MLHNFVSALLFAILSDPVLLQAVDPQVLANTNIQNKIASPPPDKQIPNPVPVFLSKEQDPPKLGRGFSNLQKGNTINNNMENRPGRTQLNPTILPRQNQPKFINFNNLPKSGPEENLKSFPAQKQRFGAAFTGFKAPNIVKPSGKPLQTGFFNQAQPNHDADQPNLDFEFIPKELDRSELEKLKFEERHQTSHEVQQLQRNENEFASDIYWTSN